MNNARIGGYVAWIFTVAATVVAADGEGRPTISVGPTEALIDSPVVVRATGLSPGARTTVRTAAMDSRDREWISHGVFVADSRGDLDLTRSAPSEGTYNGIDGMGLFWSAEMSPRVPEDQRASPVFGTSVDKPHTVRIALEVEGKEVAECRLTRHAKAPEVIAREIKDDGLVGVLYTPPGKGPFPAVIVLSGSGGGIARGDAALLASHGYVTFALAYFRAEGLPDALVKIPIDYLKKGMDWLRKQPGVDAERLGVMGGSKGAELALIVGSMFPEIRAVVAYAPTHVVWQGLAMNGPPPDESSWTYKGEPLPYVRVKGGIGAMMMFVGSEPFQLVKLYEPGLDDTDAVNKAAIAVERIKGPVMLISGGEDAIWPGARMSEQVVERLKKSKFAHACEHLNYPGAGHAILKAYLPSGGTVAMGRMVLGGTSEANAKAQADSWPKVLKFLEAALKNPKSTVP